MSTTTVFAEILVVGAQSLLAYLLIALGLFGEKTVVGAIEALPEGELLIGGILITVSYSLGVVVDRAYVFIWQRIDKAIRNGLQISLDQYAESQILIALKGTEELHTLFSFYTSRLRILRASILNFLLMTIGLLISLLSRRSSSFYLFATILAALLFAGSIYGYVNLSRRYYPLVKSALAALAD